MRVAVIGAGASGLTAIKCCLDEGLDVTCYERTNYISGLWHYTDQVQEGQACVMKSTIINTTKEIMSYSDFPMPKEFAMYMHNREVDNYLHMYADRFDLKKWIKFKTEVLSVTKANDFKSTGRWVLKIRESTSTSSTGDIFDAVLVCTGHHAEKNMVSFPGMDKFKGNVIHSQEYKHGAGYEDTRVAVVGIGNSGGDIATELSRVASQVFLSTRSGAVILSRTYDKGTPVTFIFGTRYNIRLSKWFPGYFGRKIFNKLNERFDHRRNGLLPKRPGSQHPTMNDELPERIATGTIKVKPNIAEFTPTGVRFEDGSGETVDHVILATGYIFGFPFLDKSVVNVVNNEVNLYKYMFPPNLDHCSLAIIGCVQPLGSVIPICEMQCRLATRVFKGDVILPEKDAMLADIDAKKAAMAKRYMKSKRHTIQVDFVDYMDQLADLNGNKPNILKMFFTDPKLAWECFFGPCTPYQYRLQGPGAWSGAREAIMTQLGRTFYPLSGDAKFDTDTHWSTGGRRWLIGLCMMSAMAIGYCSFQKNTCYLKRLSDKCLQF